MQCPSTKSSLNFLKFYLVPAASSTTVVSKQNNLIILLISFTKAILISLCELLITLAASATLILGALCVPEVITDLYNSSTK